MLDVHSWLSLFLSRRGLFARFWSVLALLFNLSDTLVIVLLSLLKLLLQVLDPFSLRPSLFLRFVTFFDPLCLLSESP